MHETSDDIDRLQDLLDRSYAGAGRHLRDVITPERRLSAGQLSEMLTGVRILGLATVTADGRPLVGPVDGLFYRGEFWFGSAPHSVRVRHIRARPAVSATHTIGEEIAVTVHGSAVIVDLEAAPGFESYCAEVYPSWEDWVGPAAYARVAAAKMFTFHLSSADAAEAAGTP